MTKTKTKTRRPKPLTPKAGLKKGQCAKRGKLK